MIKAGEILIRFLQVRNFLAVQAFRALRLMFGNLTSVATVS